MLVAIYKYAFNMELCIEMTTPSVGGIPLPQPTHTLLTLHHDMCCFAGWLICETWSSYIVIKRGREKFGCVVKGRRDDIVTWQRMKYIHTFTNYHSSIKCHNILLLLPTMPRIECITTHNYTRL